MSSDETVSGHWTFCQVTSAQCLQMKKLRFRRTKYVHEGGSVLLLFKPHFVCLSVSAFTVFQSGKAQFNMKSETVYNRDFNPVD